MNCMNCTIIVDFKKAGTESQAIGLAQSLGLSYDVLRIKFLRPWMWLPLKLWPYKIPQSNSIIIAAGRKSVVLASILKKKVKGLFVIALQNPRIPVSLFDLVIAPKHDNLHAENVIETHGALHKVSKEILKEAEEKWQPFFNDFPKPLIGVLIGGSNKHYPFTFGISHGFLSGTNRISNFSESSKIQNLINDLESLSKKGFGVFVITSRRTPNWIYKKFEKLSSKTSVRLWNKISENPYIGVIACSDFLIVTSDSVSMISESISSGKPVYIFEFEGKSKKLDSLKEELYKEKQAQPWNGVIKEWKPNKAQNQIANQVKNKINQWAKSLNLSQM